MLHNSNEEKLKMVDSADFTHSMKRLSNGLGFHHKKLQNKSFIKSHKNWPDFFYQEKWDFDNPSTYQQILQDLQNPWLGNTENNTKSHTESHTENTTKNNLENSTVHNTVHSKTIPVAPLAPASSSSVPFFNKGAFVDTLLLSLWFFPVLGIFVFLTENNSLRVLSDLWLPIAMVFLCFSQIYCLLCRVFCQTTYGEFIFGKKLVLSQKLLSHSYLFYVLCFWRAVLITLTGGVTLPLLSYVFKIDLLKTLTGLYFQTNES